MPIRNARPWLRLQSVPSTIVDALEEDLEASVVSTVQFPGSPAFVVQRLIQISLVMGLPTLRWETMRAKLTTVVVGDRDAEDTAGDVAASDTAWDEVIVNRATRAGSACLDRVDLVSLFKLRVSVMKFPPNPTRRWLKSQGVQDWHCPLVRSADSRFSPPQLFRVVLLRRFFPSPCATTTEQLVQGNNQRDDLDLCGSSRGRCPETGSGR